jgi:hypothetical protein
MAQSFRTIPHNYPSSLAFEMLKANVLRQASMIRQEFVTELLSVLSETHEPNVRSRLTKLIEANLKAGIAAAQKCEAGWPEMENAKQVIESKTEAKPALGKKYLKLFEQMDRVQQRSLGLLRDSFHHTQVILDRLQAPAPTPPDAPGAPGERHPAS